MHSYVVSWHCFCLHGENIISIDHLQKYEKIKLQVLKGKKNTCYFKFDCLILKSLKHWTTQETFLTNIVRCHSRAQI